MLVKQNGNTFCLVLYVYALLFTFSRLVKLAKGTLWPINSTMKTIFSEKKRPEKHLVSVGESFLYFYSSLSFYGPMKALYYRRLSYFYASRKEFDRYCRSYISSFLITSSIIFYSYKGFVFIHYLSVFDVNL